MIRACISACLLLTAVPAAAALLTGVVEDVNAQTIEMPSLPGAWQRRIEWMAPEGTEVEVGEVVVRLDPGDLIAREEQSRTDLDKRRLSAARRIDELRLQVMDAERSLAEAESALRLAELDAVIPEDTIPRLDYDRYQLAFENARRAVIRAEAELLNRREELADVEKETALEVQQAESSYARIRDALAATEIRAEKRGFIIYGENPRNGKKIFPGETLYSGFKIAAIASREDLQVTFWVHEADLAEVRPGLLILVQADAQGSPAFASRIDWVSSQAVGKEDWSDSGYFRAQALPVDGVPDGVMPGMSVLGRVAPEQDARS
jgi:multidrug resistance efflux pump